MKYVSDKGRKAFAKDLKTIYNAASEKEGREALDEVTAAWEEKYPRAMKRWYDNWDAISPIFKFSSDVRTVIYTTNAIESLNSTFRRLNNQRSVFPNDTASSLLLDDLLFDKKAPYFRRVTPETEHTSNQKNRHFYNIICPF